jgi:predicted alpha/beta-fold hydrolase
MSRSWIRLLLVITIVWVVASAVVGWWVLPNLLLHPSVPVRTETFRAQVQADLQGPKDALIRTQIQGGEGQALELWHLKRSAPKGAVIYLHGFGDDVWGTLGRARALPEWDAVGFTFRGRERDASTPCTLGAWERKDVVAAFHYLEAVGFSSDRILIAGWSMGVGVALLACEDLEKEGKRTGGALLECPFEDLEHAARDHIRGTLGPLEVTARLAEWVAIRAAGHLAQFDPAQVSPLRSSEWIVGRVALISGDVDRETPIEGVKKIARFHPDLTVISGAGHCEASNRFPAGWEAWARVRLAAWGF